MPELRSYQREGAAFLADHQRALLGDEMGTGKTVQAIAAVDQIGAATALVICPASVRPHWPRHFGIWSSRPWRAQVVETTTTVIDPEANLIVASYATARAPAVLAQLRARRFDVLILDEAQNLRSVGTRQTRTVYGNGGLLEQATHGWGLSGSICPNGWARELYPHLKAFGVTTLTEPGFERRYHVLKETRWGSVPVAHRNMPELKEMLRGVYLRRTIAEVAPDLPALMVATTPIEADAQALLEVEGSPALAEIRAALAADDDLDLLTVLEHASGEAVARLRHATGVLKVPGAVALLRDELEAGLAKVVVFAVHRAVIAGLAEGLADFGAVVLEGETRPVNRQAAIDRFASDPTCRAFIAQVAAGGVGISLTAAHHVVMVEQDWSVATNSQAIARCRRIGQTQPVLARYLCVPDSLDEAIAATLARKAEMGAEIEAAS